MRHGRTKERVGEVVVIDGMYLDPGYWTKSKILVLRIWRGTPLPVAEVWTPITTDCDLPPITGLYFTALVRSEKGRRVASNSPCDCNEKAVATKGSATLTIAGTAFTSSAIVATAGALLWLGKVIRRIARMKRH